MTKQTQPFSFIKIALVAATNFKVKYPNAAIMPLLLLVNLTHFFSSRATPTFMS